MLGFLLSPIEFVLITIYAPLVSLKALESETSKDDTNMLAFWVTLSAMSAAESITYGALWLFPFYTELRFALVIYMLFFEGGKMVYKSVIDPTYQKAKKKIPEDLMDKMQKDPKTFLMEMGDKAREKGMELFQQIQGAIQAKQVEASSKAEKAEKKKAKQAK
eukprot:Skav212465  [mRNA]  locus=scaffold385:275858:277585:- [translate_table: standard]